MSYLKAVPLDETTYATFAAVKEEFRFIPNFFRAQTLRTDLIDAQAGLFGAAMVKAGALTRQQKEYIFLVCSSRNLSTYCATAHCEIVRMLGIEGPEPEQVAIDHTAAALPLPDKALLNFAVKLNDQQLKIGPADIAALRTYGFSDEQILEAVIVVGLAKFANFVSIGLGATPDFDNPRMDFSQTAASGR
jgi:uncharacterized peroxidase-related enzyme